MTPTNLIEQLSRDEDRRASAYQDGLGYWTIGVGTCIDARKGCGLTDPEIDLLLSNRIAAVTAQLSQQFPWTDVLDEVRRGVLLNMAYQMGIHGLAEFRQMLQALQQGDYSSAAAAMLDSTWAKSQSPDRAQRLSKQMETGEWQ